MSAYPTTPEARPRLPDWALALIFYIVLAIGLTWPLVLRFPTDIPGGFHKDGLEDAYQNVWNLWWTVEALSRPTNLWVTDAFFFPEQPNLLYHTLSPVNTIMVAPITALWGPIAGFNAVALLSFILGGMGMWLLARERVGAGPALLAGIVYVASPFHTAALITDGQLQIFAHHWLPWYVLFLLRTLKPDRGTGGQGGRRIDGRRQSADHHPSSVVRRRSSVVAAGFFLALVAYGDWYYTLFMLFFTAGAGLWAIWRARAGGWPAAGAIVARLAGVGVIFTLLVLPIVAPMLREASRADYMNLYPADDPLRLSADLIAYLVPHRHQSLWGGAPWDWGVSYGVNRRFFVGVTVALLALLALRRFPAARPWGLLTLGAGVLSLGPELQFNDVRTGIPLPWALFADLPIVRLTRQPDRLNVLVTIGLGMLAAYGAAGISTQRAPRDTGIWGQSDMGRAGFRPSSFVSPQPSAFSPYRVTPSLFLAACAALIILEYLPAPMTTRVPPVPPFLAGLPAAPAGALLEYPFHVDVPYRDAERMLFQTIHERPISGGYHSRLYPQPQLGLPALRDLRTGFVQSDIVREPGGWPAALNTLGFSHIIGYKQQPLGPISLQPADEAPFKALVEAGLGVDAPIYEDEWLIAYAVPPADPAPVIGIREGWGPVERPAAPEQWYRWLSASGAIGLHTPAAGTYRLSFTALPAGGPRTLRIDLPTSSQTLTIASASRRYDVLLTLPAGATIVRLTSVERPTTGDALEGNGDLRLISIRFSDFSLAALP